MENHNQNLIVTSMAESFIRVSTLIMSIRDGIGMRNYSLSKDGKIWWTGTMYKKAKNTAKAIREIDMLKDIISEQTEQIYKLYKRINELNEQVSQGRNSQQQEDLQKRHT